MGHEDAGGVAEGWDQLHHIPHQMLHTIVLLLGGAICISVTPGGWREGGREGGGREEREGGRKGGNEGVRRGEGGRKGGKEEGRE